MSAPEGEQLDIWRHSLLRYLGYSNELGESFRPIIPRLVVPSYLIAFGYVLGDTMDKAMKAKQEVDTSKNISNKKRKWTIASATVDTLLWQTAVGSLLNNRYHFCTN
jgi:fission process protein 1